MSTVFQSFSAQLSTVASDEKLTALCANASNDKLTLDFLREAFNNGGSPGLAARAKAAGLDELAVELECFADIEKLLEPYVAKFGAAMIDHAVRRIVGPLVKEVHTVIEAGDVFQLETNLDTEFGLALAVPRRFGKEQGAAGPIVALLSRTDAKAAWTFVEHSPLALEPEKARALYEAAAKLVQDPPFVAHACQKTRARLDATGATESWFTVMKSDNTLSGRFTPMAHLQPKAGIAVYQLATDVDEESLSSELAVEMAVIATKMLGGGDSYVTISREVSDEREESAPKRLKS